MLPLILQLYSVLSNQAVCSVSNRAFNTYTCQRFQHTSHLQTSAGQPAVTGVVLVSPLAERDELMGLDEDKTRLCELWFSIKHKGSNQIAALPKVTCGQGRSWSKCF